MEKIISPIKQRLFQFLESEGIRKEEFYLKTGIHSSNFKSIGAKSELGGDKIAKILMVYQNIDAVWLVTGKGKMYGMNEILKTGRVSLVSKNEKEKYISDDKIALECLDCKTKDKFIELMQNENRAIKEVNALLKEKIAKNDKGESYTEFVGGEQKNFVSTKGETFAPEEVHL